MVKSIVAGVITVSASFVCVYFINKFLEEKPWKKLKKKEAIKYNSYYTHNPKNFNLRKEA